jgi:hypothetical protein
MYVATGSGTALSKGKGSGRGKKAADGAPKTKEAAALKKKRGSGSEDDLFSLRTSQRLDREEKHNVPCLLSHRSFISR